MSRYRTVADIAALVQPARVHRDVYLSEEVFALEREHFFANTWNYLGHASQVPNPGDVLAVEIAGRPLMLVRQADGGLRVLYNRCAHKGARLVDEPCANVGKFFRCPYHA
ncbi:MAG TPA: Rieske 2Fe-2S domain-containing protein, partial [Burkholderiaceae bacterium]